MSFWSGEGQMSLICDFVLRIKFVLIGGIIDKIYYFFLFLGYLKQN